MEQIELILTGGFLGAGKTTLLAKEGGRRVESRWSEGRMVEPVN